MNRYSCVTCIVILLFVSFLVQEIKASSLNGLLLEQLIYENKALSLDIGTTGFTDIGTTRTVGQVFKPTNSGLVDQIRIWCNTGGGSGLPYIGVNIYDWLGASTDSPVNFKGNLLGSAKTVQMNPTTCYPGREFSFDFMGDNEIYISNTHYYYLEMVMSVYPGFPHYFSFGLSLSGSSDDSLIDGQAWAVGYNGILASPPDYSNLKDLYLVIDKLTQDRFKVDIPVDGTIFDTRTVDWQFAYTQPETGSFNTVKILIDDFYSGEHVQTFDLPLTPQEQTIGQHVLMRSLMISRPGYFKATARLQLCSIQCTDGVAISIVRFSIPGASLPTGFLLKQNFNGESYVLGDLERGNIGQVIKPVNSGVVDKITFLCSTSGSSYSDIQLKIYNWLGTPADSPATSKGNLLASSKIIRIYPLDCYPNPKQFEFDLIENNEIYLSNAHYYFLEVDFLETGLPFWARVTLALNGTTNDSVIDGQAWLEVPGRGWSNPIPNYSQVKDLYLVITGTTQQQPTVFNINQFESDGVTPILEGTMIGESKIIFKADISDADGDLVKLQVDLKKITDSFDDNDTSAILESEFVLSGTTASIEVDLEKGEYHWRARAMDDQGNASDWAEFGSPGNIDFGIGRFPVILVPGILGSWTKDSNFDLFTRPEPIDQSLLIFTEETDAKLLKKLKQLGYLPLSWFALKNYLPLKDYQVYKCPYDWRLPNQQIAENYLIPCIQKAKSETGAPKVNIIAHSMGGLVTRAYIQSDIYRRDIDKFVMLGTPNHGSAESYYPWESGNMAGDFGVLGKIFERAVINRIIDLSSGQPENKLAYVHTFFPSVRQLLPTFDFLKDQWLNLRSIGTHTWQNDLLPDLNTRLNINRLKDNIDTKIFASEGMGTLEKINVIYPNLFNFFANPSLPYPDGQPTVLPEEYSSFGDGTVLSSSAQLPEALVPLEIKTKTISDPEDFLSHTNLPNAFFDEVSEFLGTPSDVTDLYSPTLPKEILVVSLASPAELLVIDSQGRKLGFDNVTRIEKDDIPGGIYSGRDEIELAAIIDPVPGEYQVQITGNATGEFHTGITYAQDECPITPNQDNLGFISTGQVQTFTIDLSKDCQEEAVSYSLDAMVEIKPDSFKLTGKERHITALIQLPEPYKVEDIDPDSIRLNNTVSGLKYKFISRDKLEKPSKDQPNTLKVKFSKTKISDILTSGDNQLTVSGNLLDGTRFAGSAIINPRNK